MRLIPIYHSQLAICMIDFASRSIKPKKQKPSNQTKCTEPFNQTIFKTRREPYNYTVYTYHKHRFYLYMDQLFIVCKCKTKRVTCQAYVHVLSNPNPEAPRVLESKPTRGRDIYSESASICYQTITQSYREKKTKTINI